MKKLIIDKLPRVTKNRKKLEKELNVKITNRGKEVFVDGNSEDEYTAEKILDALEFGFPFSTAMQIKKDDCEFEIINIKDHTTKKNLSRIRARIIGTKGKTLKTLCDLTNCYFELKDNQIGIIGFPEEIKNAQEAIISIIRGSKQGNVYAYLKKHKVSPVGDLGLKE